VCECTLYQLMATRRGLAATELVLEKRPRLQSPVAKCDLHGHIQTISSKQPQEG
ncbi:hypothetical protein P7K49_015844, partial [Saguinus oedipus]